RRPDPRSLGARANRASVRRRPGHLRRPGDLGKTQSPAGKSGVSLRSPSRVDPGRSLDRRPSTGSRPGSGLRRGARRAAGTARPRRPRQPVTTKERSTMTLTSIETDSPAAPLSTSAGAGLHGRLQPLHGQTIVIKYGGAAMERPGLRDLFARDVALIRTLG